MSDQVTKDHGLLHVRIWMTICLLCQLSYCLTQRNSRFSHKLLLVMPRCKSFCISLHYCISSVTIRNTIVEVARLTLE